LSSPNVSTPLKGFQLRNQSNERRQDVASRREADFRSKTLLVFDYFHDVKELADPGNAGARAVLQS
jgi:aconitate hydratase 2/2-methylisocitrate dehydratase